jgi:hypothetical protein
MEKIVERDIPVTTSEVATAVISERYPYGPPPPLAPTMSEIIESRKPRTMAQLAQEAIDIQNACNIMGISKSFAKVVQEVRDLIEVDRKKNPVSFTRHENVNSHPVVRLWASKIHDMCSVSIEEDVAYSEAYLECQRLAEAGI